MFDPGHDEPADQKEVETQGVMVNNLMDNMEQVAVEKTREQQAPVRKVLVAGRKGRKKNGGQILMGRIEDLFRQQTPAFEGRDKVNCKRKEQEGLEVPSMVGTKRAKRE